MQLNGEYTIEQLADIVTNHMVENQVQKCLCCAESMSLLSRTMSKQLVGSLVKIAKAVNATNKNDVVPSEFKDELFLTRTQYANLNVLKKHGLIAKLEQDADKRIHYCITRRGFQFLTGQIAIPKTVWSFRNKLVRKSEDVVSVSDIMGEPYTDIRESLFFNPPENNEVEQVRVHHKVKRKKRKNPCPNCATGELKKKSEAEIVNDLARVTWYFECDVCQARMEA